MSTTRFAEAETVGFNVPENAEFIGTLTAGDDLGVSFDEPTSVGYLNAPLEVFKTPRADGLTRFDVVVKHDPLGSSELLDLLKVVAPDSRLDSQWGVMADWDILEPSVGDPQKLIPLHQKLGGPWNEFGRSHPALSLTLRGAEPPRFGRHAWNGPWHNRYEVRTTPTSLAGLQQVEAVIEKIEPAPSFDAESLVYEAVRRFTRAKQQVSAQTKPELARRYGRLRPEVREQLLRPIISQLSEVDRDHVFSEVAEITERSIIYEDGMRYTSMWLKHVTWQNPTQNAG